MPGLFDNIGSGGLFSSLGNAFGNIAAGMENPAALQQLRQQQQGQQATYQSLLNSGAPEHIARAAALNPKEFGQFASPYLDTAPKVQNFPNPLTGDQNFYAVTGGAHPSVAAMPVGGGQGGMAPTQSGLFNQIETAKQQGASQADLIKLIPVESGLRNAVENMLAGGIPATNFSMRGAARDLAIKLGTAIDPNFNELELMARRKLYTDLNSSSPNSMGGILSNGKSAFGHLATLGEKLAELHNYSGPDVLGGAIMGKIGNAVSNTLATPEQQAKIAATQSPRLKYGQESTKFYAGTGGGEAERMNALKELNPQSGASKDFAAFLQSEKELMLERFAQKEAQIRSQLGDNYLAKNPVMKDADKRNLARIDAAVQRLQGGGAAPAGAPSGPKPVSSKAEYDALPSGTQYTAPDGSVRTKK